MQFSWETILMFCFPGAKIWSRFVNVCSFGLAPKDNVRHDKFRFFDLLQIEVTLELYLSPFFHKGKNMEELTTNTEVSKVSLKIIIISGTWLSTFYTAEFDIDHEK